MAIDYVIDYRCYPKQELTAEGIQERLKGRARAEAVIDLFRRNDDPRPVSEIGFELARNTPDGPEETRVIMVQDLLDRAEGLAPYEHYCEGCPANNTALPFGCIGQIEYPISRKAEVWLLKQLPVTSEVLPWMLLREGLRSMQSDGSRVNDLRREDQPFFEEHSVLARSLGELSVNSNQLFEMLFLVGHLNPSYAAPLLVFFKAIPRTMDADEMMALSQSPEDAGERYPFLLAVEPDDDGSIRQIKRFLRALYLAWVLNVRLLLDV